MTKQDALRDYNTRIKPYVVARYGPQDKPALRQAWNDYTDQLCKAGKITQRQYERWIGPIK
jgi:hypothetical protein